MKPTSLSAVSLVWQQRKEWFGRHGLDRGCRGVAELQGRQRRMKRTAVSGLAGIPGVGGTIKEAMVGRQLVQCARHHNTGYWRRAGPLRMLVYILNASKHVKAGM